MEFNQISKAEWVVMSALWEESPLSSRELIQRLNIENKWSDTTIKTFISRLVKKGLIDFETQGRKHIFFPIFSEKKCIENEMFMIIKRVYGGTLRYSTDHFDFYGDNQTDFIKKIAIHLESNYLRVVDELNYNFDSKQSVYIYKSQARLHSALGSENAPSWVRAGGSWGIIHLAPKVAFVNDSAEKIALHVFTEIALYNINTNIPSWLIRGAATYYGGWLSKERIANALKKNIDNINLNELFEMKEDFISFGESFGFEVSFTIVQYIINKYGINVLSDFVRNPYQYYEFFSLSKKQFFENWLQFVKKEYL
ncbi:BlaI/MecI/CopY family transcriptional regulator [Mycoplasmatota bacterium WC30]